MTRATRGHERLISAAGSGRTDRRRLLKGAAGMGAAMAAAGSLGSLGRVAAQETTLSFYHDKAPWQDYFVDMGDMAQEAIGINWDPVSYPDTTSYQAAVLPSLPTADAPDFFTWWSGFRIEDLYREGVLLEVTDIWEQAIADGNLPESLAAAFTFEGGQYAMPSHVSYWPVFYNKRVFEENELEPPTTWEEMLAAADTLQSAGVIPFAGTQVDRWPSFIWFEEMVMRTDPAFYEALTAGQASYTDPAAVQAMETWKDLIEAEYFNSFDLNLFNDIPGMFTQGQIAMLPIGTWYQSNFLAAGLVPGEDYDLFVMPNINPDITENVIIVETGALAIPANATDTDASREMATWWISPEAQTAWTEYLGDAPANPQAESMNPVLNGLIQTLSDQNYRLLQRYWEASPVPIVEGAVDFLAEFMLNPDQYMSVLERIQELAETEWARREG
jgi:multiple sugar transport system substrate-binding protein